MEALPDAALFESALHRPFAFLVEEHAMEFSGIRTIGDGDPRDSALVARYRNDASRVEIAWSKAQDSVTVSMRLGDASLPSANRHVYLEPFVEFVTQGREASLVPPIYPRMSEAAIVEAMAKRRELFESVPLESVLLQLAHKLRRYLPELARASPDVLMRYREWFEATKGDGGS
jgi:hypothetical protein